MILIRDTLMADDISITAQWNRLHYKKLQNNSNIQSTIEIRNLQRIKKLFFLFISQHIENYHAKAIKWQCKA